MVDHPKSSVFGMERLQGLPNPPLSGVLLSIHMTSNRPDDFVRFLDRLENATCDMSSVEVVVKIDDTDEAMNRLLEREAKRRPFQVTYMSTPPPDGFYGLWKSYDDLLKICDPKAYFVVGLNDEMYFETKGWDRVLRKYVGLFPDHIFRLRTSTQRSRNYYDFWEPGFANDTSALMTKRWLDLGGGWCPCNGPDTFQQCVAFYFGWLHRFRTDRITREFPIYDIEFGGSGANVEGEIKGRALRRRYGGAIKPWFVLMSHKMQQEAARRAQKLHAHIWAFQNNLEQYEVRDESFRHRIVIVNFAEDVLHTLSYGLSATRIRLTNAYRTLSYAYYVGYVGDKLQSGWLKNLIIHLCFRYEYLGRLLDVRYFEPLDPKHPSLTMDIVFLLLSGPGRLLKLCKQLWRQVLGFFV